jgi:hypothetical protein
MPLPSAVRLCLTGRRDFRSAASPPLVTNRYLINHQRHSRMLEEAVRR